MTLLQLIEAISNTIDEIAFALEIYERSYLIIDFDNFNTKFVIPNGRLRSLNNFSAQKLINPAF
jgi:hypothetical protein